ncbi:MAG: helix-turn-helix transcriptional regulator [Clostridia bacterium]|nr:helix-turn-helix transcriptional regulator [Clostridia bacterium]
MAQKNVGALIKEARTKAGLSQEKLAAMIDGLSASEVSKAERGEKELTQAELKAIAKATGVTQKSLLEAAGYVSSAKKPASGTASKPASAASKKASSSTAKQADEIKLTAAEKRVLGLYRAASAAVRKDAEAVLKGEKKVQEENANPLVEGLLGGALDILSNIGKK